MARTVAQGFQEFRSKLEITGLQTSTVSIRHQGIREVMGSNFTVVENFLTGSYQRNTLIAPLSEADVDIFVVLDKQHKTANQAALLDKVRAVLKQAYKETTDISRDGQAVTITFSDFKVDVVPAFYQTILFINTGNYLIPNTITQSWIETNPKKHIDLWAKRNAAQKGLLIPLIKMIKAWNEENGKLLTSFHLECLILEIMRYKNMADFPSAIRIVFEDARGSFQQVKDPVMYSSVGGYLTSEKTAIIARNLDVAYTRAKESVKYYV